MKIINTDILVLGSGIAGLSFAIKAATLGKVAIVTKSNCASSNSQLAQGGIACVLDEGDTFKNHIADTLKAGDGHCNISTVENVVKNAPQMIQDLISLGIKFNTNPNSTLELGKEGAHSNHRIVHVNDESGLAIVNALLEKARGINNIQFYEYHFGIDLLKEKNVCTGAIVFDIKQEEEVIFNSQITILATGGAGQIFEQSTNPEIATGDGFAMAHSAGAKIDDMEFVQFHPTVLYHPKANGFLITEALRGFGAELVSPDGKPFMQKYHPLGSLAPRDIVSRAMFAEMQSQQLPSVFLDARFLDATELKKKFPGIYKRCLELEIDITKELIPVAPAAHYMCGGVVTDINGKTNIINLFALGEVACTGLHGANRLASNSLLEGLVFAENAFQNCKLHFIKIPKRAVMFNQKQSNQNGKGERELIAGIKQKIRVIMWKNVGIKRNKADMLFALEAISEIDSSVTHLLNTIRLSQDLLELRNLTITAKLILESALKRSKSLGTHFIEEKSLFIKPNQILV
jgi:L-aspartate oxidase